ncbi:MAG: hypothetical protein AAGG07_09725 [Planctomycetota bacterium]
MTSIGPSTGSIPFRVANAYGVGAPARVAPTAQPTQQPQTADTVSRPAVGGDLDSNAARITRLIGAVVPGRVDFSGETPRQDASLPLYRHPADKNTAATGVETGRIVDLTG